MKYTHLIKELDIEIEHLDVKKQQTGYKKKYVTDYMIRWLSLNTPRRDVTDINFIDCMCNAGIYQDGDQCISMEVLLMFIEAAERYKNKRFNLFINDRDKIKTGLSGKIAEKLLLDKKPSNINIFINTLDVNDYLQGLHLFGKYFHGGASVLFIDPKDFGTVIISRLTHFIARYCCDVIFNLFAGDGYAPGGIDKRVRKCVGSGAVANKDELAAYIAGRLKTGKAQHSFSYRFADHANAGLYQIIYATPNIKGLEAIKDALWETFNADFYHRDFEADPKQLSMFAEGDDRDALLSAHARVAKELLHKSFAGRMADYRQIETFLIENTMVRKTDFIRCVLKPLVETRLAMRQGAAENYKDDEYYFMGAERSWAEAYSGGTQEIPEEMPSLK